jgi:hypothetical protein
MFIGVITLLILISVVVSYVLLARKLRNDEVMLMVERANTIATVVLDTAKFVVDFQESLDKKMNELDRKMDALSRFVDSRNTYVTFQQNQFNELARSDMLAARREELLRTKELKVALERLMGVALTSRQPPAPNDVLAIENLTERIEELEKILSDQK